jgi:hypothetical protein
MIRQDTGVEVLMIFFTGLRKYRCLGCEESFRALDRRSAPRAESASMEKQMASGGAVTRSG